MAREMVTRRRFLKGLGIAAGGAVLAACKPQVVKETVIVEKPVEKVVEKIVKETVIVEGTPKVVEKVVTVAPAPPEEVTLDIWHTLGAALDEGIKKWNAAYKQVAPHVTLDWVTQEPDQLSTKLLAAFMAGKGPDSIPKEGADRLMAAEYELQQWMNMKPRIEFDPELQDALGHMREPRFSSIQYADRIWGLPITTGCCHFFIRKSWLDKVGWPKPYPYLENYDDMLELAKLYTFEDPNGSGVADTFGVGMHGSCTMIEYWSEGGGGIAATKGYNAVCYQDTDMGKPTINDPVNLEVMGWIQKFYKAEVVRGEPGWTFKEFYQGVLGGISGMGRLCRWNPKSWDADEVLQGDYVAVVMPPMGKEYEGQALASGGTPGVVNGKSPRKEEAYNFLKWMLSKEAQTILYETQGTAGRVDLDYDTLTGGNEHEMFFLSGDGAKSKMTSTGPMAMNFPLSGTYHADMDGAYQKCIIDPDLDPAEPFAKAQEKAMEHWQEWYDDVGKDWLAMMKG